MTPAIALQMYAIRDALANDFDNTLQRVANIGYSGLELIYHIPGATNAHAAKRLRELNLQVPAAHVPALVGDEAAAVIAFAEQFGVERLVTGRGLGHFDTLEHIKVTCDAYNQSYHVAQQHGYPLSIHNHWMEFERLPDGRFVYHVMCDLLEPGILFELDTYWIRTAGLNPIQIIDELGQRTNLLHIKDGPATIHDAQVAVGTGTLDIPAIVRHGVRYAEWLIVEFDWCATDILDAVAHSHTNLLHIMTQQ